MREAIASAMPKGERAPLSPVGCYRMRQDVMDRGHPGRDIVQEFIFVLNHMLLAQRDIAQ